MTVRPLIVLLSLLAAPSARAGEPPLVVGPVVLETPDGLARGQLASIDLTHPDVDVRVIVPADVEGMPDRVTTEAVVRDGLAELAINANYFGGGGIIGLAAVDGQIVSEPRGEDPVLLLVDAGRAVVRRGLGDIDRGQVRQAVAGVGPGESVPDGTLLVRDGENIGSTARVQPMARHPRTAAGVDAAGETLYLLVVDGRQPGHSVGVTLPELADLLIAAGADDALNLDGGGSAAMVWRDPEAGIRGTRQSGDVRRPVPVLLAVTVRSHETAAGAEAGGRASE